MFSLNGSIYAQSRNLKNDALFIDVSKTDRPMETNGRKSNDKLS